MSDVTAISPESLKLTCKISEGEPKASIQWQKDGKDVKPSKQSSMTYEDDTAELTLQETDIKDAGTYLCIAKNKIGQVSTQCTVIVQCKL